MWHVEKVGVLPPEFQQKLLTFVHKLFTGKKTVCLTSKKTPKTNKKCEWHLFLVRGL